MTPGLPPGPPGDLLDVGCGSGEILLGLQEVGWRCHGVEVSERAVSAARAAGLTNVQLGELPHLEYPTASFDAVRFWHSLEHVRSPRLHLAEARRVLRPGGRLMIGVPNFASLLSRSFRDRWFYLDVPRHLWHFEPSSLSELVSDVGFRVESTEFVTPSTPILGTFLRLLGRNGTLMEHRWLWISTLPFAVLLDSVRLGDGMVLIARVPD